MLAGRLRVAFLLTIGILAVEVTGAVAGHSLALLSDAGHVLTDLGALGLAWFAAAQAARPADARHTFGYHRFGILAALANAVTLILVGGFIAVEAVTRLGTPQQVTPWIMVVAAATGLATNLVITALLRGDGGRNLNVRAAVLHVAGDMAAAAAVILGAVVIALTGRNQVDPILALLIAVLIAVGAWRILRESGAILMERSPRDLDVDSLAAAIAAHPGVSGVHDLHVWSLDGSRRALSAHLGVGTADLRECDPVLTSVNAMLLERFAITHSTFQLECVDCVPVPELYCSVDTPQPVSPTAATRAR